MAWETISRTQDLLVYESVRRGYTNRIEARLAEDKWSIYHSFYNGKGLNLTEEYQSDTREGAEKIVSVLKNMPVMALKDLQKKMLDQTRRVDVHIQRSFKEYNVEKWFFGINGGKPVNFVVLRYFDSIELDFIIDARYQRYEKDVIASISQSLGLGNVEEDLHVNCYYFTKKTRKHIENSKKKVLMGHIEFGFGSDQSD